MMQIRKEDLRLYVVTDRTWLGERSLASQVEKILGVGATLLQLREKDMPYDEFVNEAKEIKRITDRYHIPLIINDCIDVAVSVDADGVHLGQEDEQLQSAREILGEDKIIGISVHTVEEAITAQNYGADYIGVGAVFNTSTKKDAGALSFDTLTNICKAVTLPVVAIGGITRDNIMKLSGSGIDGVAVISAIFAQRDISSATKEMLTLANKMIGKKLI
jgi:thiamine-phosphate pyrophosphorylase